MSEDIRISILRAGVTNPIATKIPSQMDQLSATESASYQGADPHFTYKFFTTMLPLNNSQLVLFRDHVVDEVIIDVETGQPRKYLIVSDPKMHTIDGHWEFVASRMRGT